LFLSLFSVVAVSVVVVVWENVAFKDHLISGLTAFIVYDDIAQGLINCVTILLTDAVVQFGNVSNISMFSKLAITFQ